MFAVLYQTKYILNRRVKNAWDLDQQIKTCCTLSCKIFGNHGSHKSFSLLRFTQTFLFYWMYLHSFITFCFVLFAFVMERRRKKFWQREILGNFSDCWIVFEFGRVLFRRKLKVGWTRTEFQLFSDLFIILLFRLHANSKNVQKFISHTVALKNHRVKFVL